MSTLPPITDHAFAQLVKRRCEDMSRSMAEIAAELGSTPDELCRWIMAYKEPRRNKPYVNRQSPAQITTTPHSADAKRFANWRKQREGARTALENAK